MKSIIEILFISVNEVSKNKGIWSHDGFTLQIDIISRKNDHASRVHIVQFFVA